MSRQPLTVRGKLREFIVRQPVPHIMPVILPPALYDEAERQGVDMRGYCKSEPLPVNLEG